MSKINLTWILKVAAGCIAIPRSMSLFVLMLGISAKHTYSWLPTAELIAGLGFAVLEAFAVAYIFSKWKQARNDYVLVGFIAILSLSWFPVFAPGIVAEQNDLTIPLLMNELVGVGIGSYLLQLAHAGLVATLPMLVIAGVGYADSVVEVQAEAKQAANTYACDTCDQEFASKQALGGHKRHCKGIKVSLPVSVK